MGLLDDAIREHLELKRRHGADASEVARQEQDALGPARRGPEPLEAPPAAPPPGEPQAEAPAPPLETPEPAPAPVPERPPEPVDQREPEPVDEPEPAPDTPAWVDQPTVAFDAAELAEAQRRSDPPRRVREPEPEPRPTSGDDEDVLEETPDFLQETPEHDRLWFEQRPPRDFDFDG